MLRISQLAALALASAAASCPQGECGTPCD
jgi:hypothetical protein